MNSRPWKPAGEDGRDPTRFYPSRATLIADLYQGLDPFAAVKPFFHQEHLLYSQAFISDAQKAAAALQAMVIEEMGRPPRLGRWRSARTPALVLSTCGGLAEVLHPLPISAQAGARLLYLLGYRVDVAYLDTAQERGGALAEAHLYFQLLRPGGLLIGDDIDTAFEAANQEIRMFTTCQNATLAELGDGFLWFIRKE